MKPSENVQIYLFFLISLLLVSCKDNNRVDVSGIDIKLNIMRFDKDLNSLTPANLYERAPELQQKYGFFYGDFMEGILSVGNIQDTAYYSALRSVIVNKDYQELKKEVFSKYPDFITQQQELTQAFKHIKYYYPHQKIPRIVTFFSGFTVQTPIGNDYVGIGLDMFLGADSKFYPALIQSIPQYIFRRFTPENITPRVIETFFREDMFPEKDESRSLLDKMVHNGKILYLMGAVLPDVPDSLKIGYTAKQMQWCNDFESNIWAYFLENELLYETDYMKIQKFLAEAPFTPGIGSNNESAPKLGVWTGWQIVKKYMSKNPKLTLQQLMAESDAQKILTESRYKPKM
ncbi:MAG TPA: gliding motility lipoprotein GldB [Sphingobacteriaceae bacterium]|nr:gliding motility lipoprotein GldB [Sphingobacteriaceae bacterium]